MYDFKDKVVLITGATRGLGEALARTLAEEGAKLELVARDAEAARATALEIRREFGGEVFSRVCDITDPQKVQSVVEEAFRRYGRLDLVINNAAILGKMALVPDYTPEAWAGVINANLNGAYYVAHHAARKMRTAGGGRIVFVTSSVARNFRPRWGAYSVSKAGGEALVRLMAEETAETQVVACAINPGAMATGMRQEAFPEEDQSTLPSPTTVAQAFLKILRQADKQLNGRTINARDFLQ
ncbi:MAG: SDR family oxidoreductase [Candidatus Sumerlaeaceae bacterium]|nr:SDR family oxidoreductase [Candidatus Sumerlaeaceae bacterium]